MNTRKTKCRSCSAKKLTTILSLGNLFLSDFIHNDKKPPRYFLTLVLCPKCCLFQLKQTTPPNLLYTDHYGYKSGINQTMKDELKDIAKKALRKTSAKHKKLLVVDIGANDGTLLRFYPKNVQTVAIEPIRKLAKESKKYATIVINDFFNAKAYEKKLGQKKAHIVTAISCFYDINNPNTFLGDVTKILDKNGILIIQQNYLASMLENNAFDNIVHEHLEYYSLLSLEYLLNKHSIEVFDVEQSRVNGGSFRTYIAKKGTRKITSRVKKMRLAEKKLALHTQKPYKAFAKRIKNNKNKLVSYIKTQVKKDKKIYVYGASTRGNTLLQYYKLDKKVISKAVERNPEKWGKKIASLGIPIISEEQARKEKPDYMLVLPWFFKEEFIEREKKYLDHGGHFIFPLPKIEVV